MGFFRCGRKRYTMPQLEITCTAANCKKLDWDAYGGTDRAAKLIVELGDQKFKTTLFFGDVKIGLTAEYGVSDLIKGKLKYRGMAVPGGKVDLMLRALDFGPEEEEEEDDMSFLDML